MKSIVKGIFFIETIVFLVSLIFSILVARIKKGGYALQYLWIYNCVAFFDILFGFISSVYFKNLKPFSYTINDFLILFHYSFLCNFIYLETKNLLFSKYVKIQNYLSWLIGLIVLVFLLTVKVIPNFQNSLAIITSSFGLIGLSILYYLNLLDSLIESKLANNPPFWIVTGIFISMSYNLPITFFMHKIVLTKDIDLIRLVNCFYMLSHIILHLFFIKAILCYLKKEKK